MPYDDEFPHIVKIIAMMPGEEDDSGGFSEDKPQTLFQMCAFVDTVTSKEQYTAMQLQNPLDRYMFYSYRTDVLPSHYVLFEGEQYKLAGRPEDQGAQHEILRVPLKLVK